MSKSAKSPAKQARIQEKHALSDLNQRLGLYALNVRKVTENEGLLREQLEDLKQRSVDELRNQRGMFEDEISELRT